MRPAELLEGLDLENGWKVTKLVVPRPNATGGHFSTGYLVENRDGRRGFLKAMDYTDAFLNPSIAAIMLYAMTQAYLFEKQLCERCRDHALGRVVHAIDSGTIVAPRSTEQHPLVEYLIFERADGDIRAHLESSAKLDIAFALRALHHVAVGLEQLHGVDVAHQDLKPSNVLIFPDRGGSKIGDLGRAWAKGMASPYDDLPIAGDLGYAPPEFLYDEVATDERRRRFGCDMYHLGSLITFIFSRVHMNALLFKYLAPEHQHLFWGGTYTEVLPYVKAAFAEAVNEFSGHVPEVLRQDMVRMVMQLCEPDPAKRGHPDWRNSWNPYSLIRYISMLNLLSFRYETARFGKTE